MTTHLRSLRSVGLCLLVMVSVSGCARVAESNFNPFNWFNRGETRETLMPEDAQIPLDRRELVQSVTRLSLEDTLDGAILRADGLAAGLGYYEASLVAENGGEPIDGVLTFQFRASPPFGREAGVVSERTLTVRTAVFLSDFDLAGVRDIVVLAVTNSRSIRP